VIFVKTQTFVRSVIQTWAISRSRQACYHLDHCDLQFLLTVARRIDDFMVLTIDGLWIKGRNFIKEQTLKAFYCVGKKVQELL